MDEDQERVIEFSVTIASNRMAREYRVRVRPPKGTRPLDFVEHAINVMGSAIELGFSLLDAAFTRNDHRV